jgi:hypothetical protein
MKIIFSGLEDSGKSLRLAMTVSNLVARNSKWQQKTGKLRPIMSNMRFSQHFEEWALGVMKVKLQYWKDLDDIIFKDDVDIILDEVGNYFDARRYADLSMDARRWLTQSSKRGVEIYGACQDFSQIDVAFRRLVGGRGGLFHIRKLVGSRRPSATKPPVSKIWGLCSMNELDPIGYDQTTSLFKPVSVIPRFFFISRKYCEIFDTKQKIEKGELPRLRHSKQYCELDSCPYTRTSHA